MGREVRRVPADWEHPKDKEGKYIPLLENSEVIEKATPTKPNWTEEERTHYQMYENITEGTPISPVMDSPESLARWLTENHAEASSGRTASYEQWLAVIQAGYAPTFCINPEGLISGVEAMEE